MEDTLNTVTILENELLSAQQDLNSDQQIHSDLLQNKAKSICEYLKSKDRKRALEKQLKYTKELSRMIELEEIMYTSTSNHWELKELVSNELTKITEFFTYKQKYFEEKDKKLQEELTHYSSLIQSRQQAKQEQVKTLHLSIRDLQNKLVSLREAKTQTQLEVSDVLKPKIQQLESRLKLIKEDMEDLRKQRSTHIFQLQKKLMEEQQESLTINQEIETVIKQLS